MSIIKTLFGSGDPVGHVEYDEYTAGLRNHNHAAQNAISQQWLQQQMTNQQAGMQNMAGGAGMSSVAATVASQNYAQNSYRQWGQNLSPSQIRDKTRHHIASEVQKMAEEIGAPTLLHAVVLAIQTMEIPE